MKVNFHSAKRPRIEMIPLIDIVFLLLVFFIYAMLSMAVHRGLIVDLPISSSAEVEKQLLLSVTVKADGSLYVDKEQTALEELAGILRQKAGGDAETGVLLFADRSLHYQQLFHVLDRIRDAGLYRISLQAEGESR